MFLKAKTVKVAFYKLRSRPSPRRYYKQSASVLGMLCKLCKYRFCSENDVRWSEVRQKNHFSFSHELGSGTWLALLPGSLVKFSIWAHYCASWSRQLDTEKVTEKFPSLRRSALCKIDFIESGDFFYFFFTHFLSSIDLDMLHNILYCSSSRQSFFASNTFVSS